MTDENKGHKHDLLKLKENINIPFESDPYIEYEQYHCQDIECDYHEFRYLSHTEVKIQETCNKPYYHGCGLPSKETKE